jgi:hypothetical protein
MGHEKEWREKDWDMPPLYAELYARNQQLEQRLTEARALLEEVLPDRLPNWEQLIQCSVCGCSATQAQKIEHDDKCPIPRISAFLAQKEDEDA